jgi:hypothetical protein
VDGTTTTETKDALATAPSKLATERSDVTETIAPEMQKVMTGQHGRPSKGGASFKGS